MKKIIASIILEDEEEEEEEEVEEEMIMMMMMWFSGLLYEWACNKYFQRNELKATTPIRRFLDGQWEEIHFIQ